MKKLIGAALAASAAIAGASAASAETSANVSIASDYIFRGVSLSDSTPVIQGGFDWTNDSFYAGVWGSSLTQGTEIDLYAGYTPTLGPVEFDFGVIGYFYPGANDDDAEFNFYELLAGAAWSLNEQFTIGGAVNFSPDNYGETGEAVYYEIKGTYAFNEALEFTAAYGNQSIEDADGEDGINVTERSDYNTWNLGATYAFHGFSLDLRYHDTDISEDSDIAYYTYGESTYNSVVVFTIGREL